MIEKKKFETNTFYFYAQKYSENHTSDAEIKNIDMTKEFWREIKNELANDELVNVNINAKVRMSKSTVGIYLGLKVFELMKKLGKRKGGKFGMNNIARDEQEYSKRMRDPETTNTVIVTDELNELENTGENVTVERALLNVMSNVHAGRYVHRISCSPFDITDPNADICLEIISVDRKNMITHAHLYYRMFQAGNQYMQLLGHVNFELKELIEIWVKKVKKHFLKPERNRYDEKIIKEWGDKDFYTQYMIQKYQKMELITKEGIMRPRMLDYAEVILEVEEKLRSLAKLNLIDATTVRNYVKKYCREKKIPTSIVGEKLMTDEVIGILNLWKSYFKLNKEWINLDKKRNKLEDWQYESDKTTLENTKEEIITVIQAQLEELERYKTIKEEYESKDEK